MTLDGFGLPDGGARPPLPFPLQGSGPAGRGLEAARAAAAAGSRDRDPAEVRKAAQMLEGHFITMLLDELRTPLLTEEDDEGYFVPSREEQLFTKQLDVALGEELAKAGQLGLADIIVKQLLPDTPA